MLRIQFVLQKLLPVWVRIGSVDDFLDCQSFVRLEVKAALVSQEFLPTIFAVVPLQLLCIAHFAKNPLPFCSLP